MPSRRRRAGPSPPRCSPDQHGGLRHTPLAHRTRLRAEATPAGGETLAAAHAGCFECVHATRFRRFHGRFCRNCAPISTAERPHTGARLSTERKPSASTTGSSPLWGIGWLREATLDGKSENPRSEFFRGERARCPGRVRCQVPAPQARSRRPPARERTPIRALGGGGSGGRTRRTNAATSAALGQTRVSVHVSLLCASSPASTLSAITEPRNPA